jgi:3-methyladenine DNA glycosylase AlkD
MDPIISAIQEELSGAIDEKTKNSYQRFFKEKVLAYGCKTAAVSKIAKKYWKEVNTRSKPEIFSLCEELYQSGYMEEAFIVSSWVPNLKDQFEPEDIKTFRYWRVSKNRVKISTVILKMLIFTHENQCSSLLFYKR